MSQECVRIADQLRRAFHGEAWHGPSVREVLSGITAEQAKAHPVLHAHSIWELVLHIEAWVRAPLASMNGTPMPEPAVLGTEIDWPSVKAANAAEWESAKGHLFSRADALVHAMEQFGNERLSKNVPGRDYQFAFMLDGVVQHTLYHAGQIAVLKKAFE